MNSQLQQNRYHVYVTGLRMRFHIFIITKYHNRRFTLDVYVLYFMYCNIYIYIFLISIDKVERKILICFFRDTRYREMNSSYTNCKKCMIRFIVICSNGRTFVFHVSIVFERRTSALVTLK